MPECQSGVSSAKWLSFLRNNWLSLLRNKWLNLLRNEWLSLVRYTQDPIKNHKFIEEFIENVAVIPIYSAIYKYGKEKARLGALGSNISDFDLLIGCTAVENELIMVTENVSEFERIVGIKIENWIAR